jgi:Ni,Fe-hydrogenase I cytochrome b subunit
MERNGKMKNIYLYARFERLWHWLQTLLIIILLLTGFEVNGAFTLFGFGTAVEVHNFLGLTWLIAFAFFVFWIFTTGHTIFAHTRAMITGWEEVEDETSVGDWEIKTKAA